VTGCVRWVESVARLREIGMANALEIGPGRVLSGLLRRIDNSIPAAPVGAMEDIDNALEMIHG